MIPVTPAIALDDSEVELSFIRASGPGGQNVNKVATAVQLRFDVRNSSAFNDYVRERLEKLAGSRLTNDGEIVLTANRFRTQERNRADAIERLVALIAKAAEPPPPKRRPTRPTKASKERRLSAKSRRGTIKSGRGRPSGDD
ncbi:alternative ribosome rescue aminoacyl-tRNA hydrolase ArfB [Caulobacter sp. NIBR1757]|uniref:alternative ribosome rescue aminoacyl-tRNA hydrolase ArfB n=1 Tax=Caulobacter sp. NIBR1757 TaxID=3016000 RepID=UPI0022F067FD|nr:alternative ribosome rescue aminoacyl-tRNA hydrolase ArfB [Caulobacter sp. NIBR1757]WGM39416.1 Peptidyl-tRNA hydrolase ArfB [Caulobacter sp. NIBR1757]